MKKASSLLLSLTLLLSLLLTACGGTAVKNDVAVSELGTSIDSAIGNSGDMVDAPESYITSSMKLDISSVSEYVVKINSRGVNIDEYGIFKAADDAQLKELQTLVKDYLQFRLDTWMVEYMPEELPKLESAEIKTVGNYVMYAILSDSGKKAAFSALEDSLKA